VSRRTVLRLGVVVVVVGAAVAFLGAGMGSDKNRGASHEPRKCRGTGSACVRTRVKPGIYIAESARGTGRGTQCSTAHGAAWFNNPTHWTAQPGPLRAGGRIRPGVTVYLCGTISAPLQAQGGGTARQPVTVYWLPGAKLSSPNWDNRAAFSTDGHGYLRLNGGGHGIIEATALGSDLPDRAQAAVGVNAMHCNGCTVENLTIANLYVHSSSSDTSVDQTMDNGIVFSGSGLTIANNVIHDVGWALYSVWGNGNGNDSIHGNNIYNIDHGFASTSGFAGGSIGPIYFYGNDVHDYANWDTSNDAYHHDGLHCYTSDGGAGASHYAGLYIYDNTFGGDTGSGMTAQIFIEGGSGAGATPCADSSSQIWIFNNVASVSHEVFNGVFGVFSGSPHVLNNTLIGADTGGGVGYSTNSDATGETFENNVVTTANQLIATSPVYFAAGQPDYNVYANGGNNSFVCGSNYYSFGQFQQWRECIRGDGRSRRVPRARVSMAGMPESGSAVTDSGTNLSNLCQGRLTALCSDRVGRPRPARGAWNAGAY
jgi:hypothetical protein